MTMLEVENATKVFGGFTAVNKVNLTVAEGETHAIIGPKRGRQDHPVQRCQRSDHTGTGVGDVSRQKAEQDDAA